MNGEPLECAIRSIMSNVLRLYQVAVSIALLSASPATFAQSVRSFPRVTITVPKDVPSEKVDIRYVLYGSFGGYGSYVRSTANSSSYPIHASVNGKAADHVKIIVWAPGCNFETFDIPLEEGSDIQQPFLCAPLPNTILTGQIRPLSLLRTKPAEVSIQYLAEWACDFFGLADCMVPQFDLGTVQPNDDGVFEIELPDFSADPVASGSGGWAELCLVLREIKTWNHLAMLEPESEDLRSPGGALKLLPVYPRGMTFVAQKGRQQSSPQ